MTAAIAAARNLNGPLGGMPAIVVCVIYLVGAIGLYVTYRKIGLIPSLVLLVGVGYLTLAGFKGSGIREPSDLLASIPADFKAAGEEINEMRSDNPAPDPDPDPGPDVTHPQGV